MLIPPEQAVVAARIAAASPTASAAASAFEQLAITPLGGRSTCLTVTRAATQICQSRVWEGLSWLDEGLVGQ